MVWEPYEHLAVSFFIFIFVININIPIQDMILRGYY